MDIKENISGIRFPRNENLRHTGQLAPFEFKSYDRGSRIVYNYTSADYLYYIEKGLVKCENYTNGRIEWFEDNNKYFTVPDSFISGTKSKYEIIAVEDCMLYRLSRNDLEQLIREDRTIAIWWIKVLEHEYLRLQSFYQLIMNSCARERYLELRRLIPGIENRATVKDIASFLGISPVSLSRIRHG